MTKPVRAPQEVVDEIKVASRLFNTNAAELVEAAWVSFRNSPEFAEEFKIAQKAFSTGDLSRVVEQMRDQSLKRANSHTERMQALRS